MECHLPSSSSVSSNATEVCPVIAHGTADESRALPTPPPNQALPNADPAALYVGILAVKVSRLATATGLAEEAFPLASPEALTDPPVRTDQSVEVPLAERSRMIWLRWTVS